MFVNVMLRGLLKLKDQRDWSENKIEGLNDWCDQSM